MVSATRGTDRRSTFVISPNQAPPWRDIRLFFAAVAAPSLAVAVGFAVMGFWPILPFAGLELGALAAALYVTARRAELREVVHVDDDRIAIERGHGCPETRWEFQRAWVRVALLRHRHRHHASRLVLRCHGREVELGRFLIEAERCRLARDLRVAIALP